MKVDLVMWTKNGEKTLPIVLDRINHAIPEENVGKRIIVDDASCDNTRQMAKNFGWQIIANEGTGISDGANTALKHVKAEYFISFEQDLLLSKDWWQEVPTLLDNHVAIASGMRFASLPKGVSDLQKYVARKYRGEKYLSPWLRSRKMAAFTLGKTLDNTIYKTDILQSIGGFPKLEINAGVDTILAYELFKAGYDWAVNYDVQSIHLRRGLRDELNHQYWYGTQLVEIWRRISEVGGKPPINRLSVISRLLISPATGLFVALKTRRPEICYIHPLVRLHYAMGLIKGEGSQ